MLRRSDNKKHIQTKLTVSSFTWPVNSERADKSDNYIRASATFIWDRKIYFLGGEDLKHKNNEAVSTVEYFDLATEQWVENLSKPELAFPAKAKEIVVITEKFADFV